MSSSLNPTKGLIFRITHRDNLTWILDNGLHCKSAQHADAGFITIGNTELIDKRTFRRVPVSPGGTLSDYIPFYFTPFSPMMLNIKTGWGGIRKRENDEIVMIVSSIPRLVERSLPFVFTDRHAYLTMSGFYTDMSDLMKVDWKILQRRDFKRDANDPEKVERYQAEALVHRHLPMEGVLGVACYTPTVEAMIQSEVQKRGLKLQTTVQKGWYF